MKIAPKFPYLLLSLLTACSPTSKQEIGSASKLIELDKFSVSDLSDRGRLVVDNAEILGSVNSIECVDDGLIAICQNSPNAHVILYDLKNDSSQTVMTRGEGPMEMLRVSTLSSDDGGNLWLVGLMDQKVMKIHKEGDTVPATVQLAFKLPEDCLRGVTDNEDGLIVLPGGGDVSRLLRLGPSGLITDSLGNYPRITMPDDVVPNNFIFQSDIAFSPEAGKIALACKSWNYLDIVDLETKTSISLTLPIDDPITLDRFEVGGAVSYNPRPFWLMFAGVAAAPESFFVGYTGAKVESPEDLDKQPRSILEFDWDGTPLRKLDFANDVVAFAVSKDGKKLYTVENNPDPMLYEYLLN